MRKLIINIDFDQTIVPGEYPKVGKLLNGAKQTIRKWKSDGHTIIISTCRVGQHEIDARDFLRNEWIPFDYFNENSQERIKQYGADCRKISCDIQFDDKCSGGFLGWRWADEILQKKANHKPVIVCIIGESGTGKTTIAEYCELEYGIPMIQSYTDRPKRCENENGHTFVTPEQFDAFREEDMIAFTQFGDCRYCCLKEDVRDYNTYVIDESGYLYLIENFKDEYNIIGVRLRCDLSVRLKRVSMDRIMRDDGRFNLSSRFYDYVIFTNNEKEMTRSFMDEVIKDIL